MNKTFNDLLNKIPKEQKEQILNKLKLEDPKYESILEDSNDYLTRLYNKKTQDKDKQLEFVINFGPQASGKGVIKNKIYPFYDNINVDEIAQLLCKKEICDSEEYFKDLRPPADKESDRRLIKSIMAKNNIVWETMGANIKWIIYYILFMKKHNYKIVISFPIVKLKTLVERCQKRKQTASCEKIPDIRKNVYNNFLYLLPFVDQVVLFDNNNDLRYIYKDDCIKVKKEDFDKIFDTESDSDIIKYLNEKTLCEDQKNDITEIPFKQIEKLNQYGGRKSNKRKSNKRKSKRKSNKQKSKRKSKNKNKK